MNDLEYLNQIAVKPVEKPTLFDKKTKLILIIVGALLLVAILIMAVAAGSSSKTAEPTEVSELVRLYRRSEKIEKTLTTYTPKVKSSSLRSSATSLSTIAAELKSTSNSYITKTFGATLSAYPLTENDSNQFAALDSALSKAQLNGILDRNFASEFYFQIRYLLVIESSIIEKTTNAELKSYLTSSQESLTRLGETFHSFSESE